MVLSRDAILGAQDFVTKDVEVAEWGGTVRVRGLSSRERDKLEEELGRSQNFDNLRARVAVMAIVDEDGQRVFKDEDAELLGTKNCEAVAKVFDAVRELSGMGDDAIGVAEGN